MTRPAAVLVLASLLLGTAHAAAAPLVALCYHDVVATAAEQTGPDTITVDDLVRQLAWLDAEGYQPITLDTWQAARHGGPLPDKPVLLTFDDGFASFHRLVLPLLELFHFPAVVAPVTSWVGAPPGSRVPYGSTTASRDTFMTWQQIRDAVASGLVEVASHTDDLHRGIPGNPFGNSQPAAVTLRYRADRGDYEDEDHYRARLRRDLARSIALIERHTGVHPRVVVWPYGAYNAAATAEARALGLDYSFTLDATPNSPLLHDVHRLLVGADMDLGEFAMTVRGLYAPRPLRAAQVSIDDLYDPDPARREQNLDRLLDRIKALHIDRVFLQAFADPDGDGVADAAYFPTRHLPMRADLFNRVAWQLRTRAGVQVFAAMPVLAFRLPNPTDTAGARAAETRRTVSEIYDDLGRSSRFAGVLFEDGALAGGGGPAAPGAGGDLIEFTDTLAGILRRHEPALVTARSLRAPATADPAVERAFARKLRVFLDHYDYATLKAVPDAHHAPPRDRWLTRLVARVARQPRGLERTVFDVQTLDPRTGNALGDAVVARQLDALLNAGARNIAWSPDDFLTGQPGLATLRARVSLSAHPAVLP